MDGGVIEGAHLVPLMELPDALPDLRKDLTYYVHCAGGYRSMIACSLMKRNGFTKRDQHHGRHEPGEAVAFPPGRSSDCHRLST